MAEIDGGAVVTEPPPPAGALICDTKIGLVAADCPPAIQTTCPLAVIEATPVVTGTLGVTVPETTADTDKPGTTETICVPRIVTIVESVPMGLRIETVPLMTVVIFVGLIHTGNPVTDTDTAVVTGAIFNRLTVPETTAETERPGVTVTVPETTAETEAPC